MKSLSFVFCLKIDFPDSERWRYERPSARPGSVQDSTLCEELQKRIADVSQKHSLSLSVQDQLMSDADTAVNVDTNVTSSVNPPAA